MKILFVTGYTHNVAVGNCLLEPGMEIITKTFTIDKLANRVRMIVEGQTPANDAECGHTPRRRIRRSPFRQLAENLR